MKTQSINVKDDGIIEQKRKLIYHFSRYGKYTEQNSTSFHENIKTTGKNPYKWKRFSYHHEKPTGHCFPLRWRRT